LLTVLSEIVNSPAASSFEFDADFQVGNAVYVFIKYTIEEGIKGVFWGEC
jgi:hypothetical protein